MVSLGYTILLFSVDLWEEKFIDCKMENTTFEHNKHGCHLDTVEENDFLIYLVSFLGSLAVLPGNIISALFMEKIGRVKIIGDWNWKFVIDNCFLKIFSLLYYAATNKKYNYWAKEQIKRRWKHLRQWILHPWNCIHEHTIVYLHGVLYYY